MRTYNVKLIIEKGASASIYARSAQDARNRARALFNEGGANKKGEMIETDYEDLKQVEVVA